MTRAAVYARVSTDEQASEGTSIDTQLARCRAHAESNGWDVADEYRDEGVSGALASRPGLDRLLGDCRTGQVDAVIVHDLDRLGRDTLNVLLFKRTLDELKVQLAVVLSPGLSPMEFELRSVFATEERRKIRERTCRASLAAAKEGRWLGGPPPYGFAIVPIEGREKAKKLDLDPAESETVRTMARLLTDGRLSTKQVADWLNANGTMTRTGRRWSGELVLHTLRSDHLTGTVTWGKPSKRHNKAIEMLGEFDPVTVDVPVLLDPELHARVQRALDRKAKGRRPSVRTYPLSLRLVGQCGERYIGKNRKDTGRYLYVCKGNHPNSDLFHCGCGRIDGATVERMVWDEVCALLGDPDRLARLTADFLGLRPAQLHAEADQLAALDRKVADAERALATAYRTGLTAGLDAEALKLATADLSTDLGSLREHRAMLEHWRTEGEQAERRQRSLAELALHAQGRLAEMSAAEQAEVLDLLQAEVRVVEARGVAHDPTVEVTGSVPAERLLERLNPPVPAEGGGSPPPRYRSR